MQVVNFFVDALGKVPTTIWLLIAFYILLKVAWRLWVHYVQQHFISGVEWTMLEIVPPREVERSPKAMELFLTNALYHWSMKGGLEAYWQGAVWFWHSLEIVSIDGQVHFYIRTPSRLKDFVTTQLYAQYPQAQVRVADDYTLAVDKIEDNGKWKFWGCEWDLEKPDAFPLKTYVDFGLDKDPKEEYKVDPLSPVIELFGSLKKGEQMWMQIVIRPTKKEYKNKGDKKSHDWVEEVGVEVEKELSRYIKTPEGKEPSRPPGFATADPIAKKLLEKAQKIGFDVGIRTCYVAKSEAWDMNNRRNIRMIFRQYANPYLNSLKRCNSTQADALSGGGFLGSFFLLDPRKVTVLCDRMLGQYRNRSFYHGSLREEILHHVPWPISPTFFLAYFSSPVFVLNVEEIATLWHFPGQILKVPTLERIESKESAPPTNLPT